MLDFGRTQQFLGMTSVGLINLWHLMIMLIQTLLEVGKACAVSHEGPWRKDLLLVKDNIVTGPFTEEEDRIILNDVETYGDNLETFKELSKKLNRHKHPPIRRRFEWLQNKPSEPHGAWNSRQDQILIEHIFQVHR